MHDETPDKHYFRTLGQPVSTRYNAHQTGIIKRALSDEANLDVSEELTASLHDQLPEGMHIVKGHKWTESHRRPKPNNSPKK